jgi:hypothetical protein
MCVAKVLLAKRDTERYERLRERLDGYALERVENTEELAERLQRFEPDVLILGLGMNLPMRFNVERPPFVISLDATVTPPDGCEFQYCDFNAVPKIVHMAIVERHKTAGCPAMAMLSMDLDATKGTAFSSMKTAGELGIVLGFFRQASLAADHLALAQLVKQIANDFAVSAQVMIKGAQGWLHLIEENHGELFGKCTILDRLKGKPRIFEAAGRTFVNYPKVIISWKNPDDPVRAGSLRDLLAHVGEGASNQAAAIESHNAILRSRNVAIDSSASLRRLMKNLEEDVHEHRATFEDKLNAFLTDMVSTVRTLSISEKEKEGVADLCRDSIERILDGFDRAETDLDVVEQVIENLEKDLELHASEERIEPPSETQQVTLF